MSASVIGSQPRHWHFRQRNGRLSVMAFRHRSHRLLVRERRISLELHFGQWDTAYSQERPIVSRAPRPFGERTVALTGESASAASVAKRSAFAGICRLTSKISWTATPVIPTAAPARIQ